MNPFRLFAQKLSKFSPNPIRNSLYSIYHKEKILEAVERECYTDPLEYNFFNFTNYLSIVISYSNKSILHGNTGHVSLMIWNDQDKCVRGYGMQGESRFKVIGKGNYGAERFSLGEESNDKNHTTVIYTTELSTEQAEEILPNIAEIDGLEDFYKLIFNNCVTKADQPLAKAGLSGGIISNWSTPWLYSISFDEEEYYRIELENCRIDWPLR